MTNAIGMTDFFVLEAGEYLERLDALAQAPAGAFEAAEEFVRIARAFRGSALMASQPAMARAAQGLESVGRAARDGRLEWDERIRGAVVQAVDDCKVLLTRVRAPAGEDTARAETLGADLEQLAGRPAPAARMAGEGLDAGARAFVAREAAAIASALDRAARSLESEPASRDALAGVSQAMSALRGVAVTGDLPPLADILVGVEGAVREVSAASGEVTEAVPELFDAGAKVLARAAREVVDLGRPAPDSSEAADFARRLLATFVAGGDVVPVESLFFDDAGPHVVRQGAPPAGISRVEVVSHGEFLAGTAAALQRATSPVLRDLRLFAMAAALRPLAGAGSTPLAGALGRLADAGRGAIGRGAAEANIEPFVTLVTQVAETLRGAAHADEADLVAAIGAVSQELGALAAVPAPAPAPAPPPASPTVELPYLVTPAEAAAGPAPAEAAAPEAAAAEQAAPAAAAEPGSPLAEAYTSLARITAAQSIEPSDLDALLGTGAAAETEAASGALEFLEPEEAEEEEGAQEEAGAEAGVVPIESLLLRGPAALRHALTLRPEIEALLAARNGGTARLAALVREVLDLVQLGLGAER